MLTSFNNGATNGCSCSSLFHCFGINYGAKAHFLNAVSYFRCTFSGHIISARAIHYIDVIVREQMFLLRYSLLEEFPLIDDDTIRSLSHLRVKSKYDCGKMKFYHSLNIAMCYLRDSHNTKAYLENNFLRVQIQLLQNIELTDLGQFF